MTREEIIRMAREVWTDVYDVESYERFAALVAAAEREACAKVCEAAGPDAGPVYCAFAIRAKK